MDLLCTIHTVQGYKSVGDWDKYTMKNETNGSCGEKRNDSERKESNIERGGWDRRM